MTDPSNIWTEDLTDAQLKMLIASGKDRYGVELRGANWRTARSLQTLGLGGIEGDPGAELPGLFFGNDEGVRILGEFDYLDDEAEADFDELFEMMSVQGFLSRGLA